MEKLALDTSVCVELFRGNAVESRDVFIAATAIVNNCALATFNVRHFSKIEGLKLFEVR